MLRWLSVGYLRRSCLYSPRKCFVVLLAAAVLVSVVLMWTQQTTSPGTEGRDRRPVGRQILTHSAVISLASLPDNLSLSPAFLLPDSFVFRIQPRMHVCGEVKQQHRGKRKTMDRFEELLEARPDGEEPPIPQPIPSHGVVFVPVLAEEKETRMAIRRTWGSGAWQRNARCRVVFVCGLDERYESDLQAEADLFSDILQLDHPESSPVDHIHPKRIPGGLAWLERTCSTSIPTFIAKADASVFVNRDALLQQVDQLPNGIHGQTTPDNSLVGSFFVIRGSESIEHLLLTLSRVKYVMLEDDKFITGVLTDAAGLSRFDSIPTTQSPSWRRADGCWLVQRLVYPDISLADFPTLWETMTDRNHLTCRSGDGCCEDSWGLGITLVSIWLIVLLLQLSILHTNFWSSFALFCSDVCNTVDSGLEDDEDSDDYGENGFGGPEDGGPVNGLDFEAERRTRGEDFLFDIHRPYGVGGHIDRF
ncbi:hypothetical protein BV898_00431 [Hypsibius exemplaris]|uniref:Hexosyltransferase n=1 Tax=Hypsibius exemplaris TaxID=2072580 RepID=A0A1W0XDH0_HYPEX|nr:hypothetical protein BV898_00431 [Hypsibius exemplaris]